MSDCERVRLRFVVPGIKIPVVGEISRHNAPNFDFSDKKGLNTCWGRYKRKLRGSVRLECILSAVESRSMAPNFTVDGQQIMILAEYLEARS